MLQCLYVYAEGSTQAQTTISPTAAFFIQIAPFLLIFIVFYLLLFLPQKKKMKEREKMLNSLKRGDRIITIGGIFGTIVNVKGNVLEVMISEGVKVTLLKSAVSELVPPQSSNTTETMRNDYNF
jgi:preprotein translocase subunit YajC